MGDAAVVTSKLVAPHQERKTEVQLGVTVLKLPISSIIVPFCGLYLESYKVIPERTYYGAYGYLYRTQTSQSFWASVSSMPSYSAGA